MSMDANVRKTIEQANAELLKGSSASSSTLKTLIATLAAYLSRADLSSDEKSNFEKLKAKLEALKNK
jgi:hypothetical protein